jgi:hypothetical protein
MLNSEVLYNWTYGKKKVYLSDMSILSILLMIDLGDYGSARINANRVLTNQHKDLCLRS